jgi:hypothetical protein
LAALNILLAATLWATPAATQEMTAAFFDCCKDTAGGERFCCWGCCYFTHNCYFSNDCLE